MSETKPLNVLNSNRILHLLQTKGPLSAAEISTKLELRKSTVSSTLYNLKCRKLVGHNRFQRLWSTVMIPKEQPIQTFIVSVKKNSLEGGVFGVTVEGTHYTVIHPNTLIIYKGEVTVAMFKEWLYCKVNQGPVEQEEYGGLEFGNKQLDPTELDSVDKTIPSH